MGDDGRRIDNVTEDFGTPTGRRVAMNNMNNFMDPSSLAQEAPLKAPPPQYNSSNTKTKTAKTAADRDNSNNDQRHKSVHDKSNASTNANNTDEPTIEELALLRILRP